MKIRIRFFHPDENKGPVVARPPRPGFDWSDEQKQLLRDNYQCLSTAELATLVGRSFAATKTMAQKVLRLRKSPEALSALLQRTSRHTFQKGDMPTNTIFGDQQVIRIRRNKKRPPYKWIRTGFKQWQMYHIYQWELHNGPVPKGKIIVFRDGDRMNCEPDNLEAITRQQLAERNNGAVSLKDGYVAHLLAPRNPALKAELLNHPDLLELKRTQIQLNRTIKAATTHDNPKSAKAQ